MKSKKNFWNHIGGGGGGAGVHYGTTTTTSPTGSPSSPTLTSSPTSSSSSTSSSSTSSSSTYHHHHHVGSSGHKESTKLFGVPLNEVFKRFSTINNIPCLVYHITCNIRQHAMQLEGIFRVPGSNQEIQHLKKLYNDGKIGTQEQLQDRCEDLHTQASLLKQYIRELPDPLFTFQLYDSFVKSHDNRDKPSRVSSLKSLLNQLPLAHYSLLKHLAGLLQEVSRNSSVNKMTSSNLAIVFGPTVMRPQNDNMIKMIEDARHVNGVFLLIIDEFDYLFNGAEFPSFLLNSSGYQATSISPSLITQLQGQTVGGRRYGGKYTSTSDHHHQQQQQQSIINQQNNNNQQNDLISGSISPRLELISPSSPISNYNDEFFSAMALRSPPPPPPPSPSSSSSSSSRFSILLPTTTSLTSTSNQQQTNNNSNNNNSSNNSNNLLINAQSSPNSPNNFNRPTTSQILLHSSPSLSPLPPTSPRSSLVLDYENPELIRLLINRTCSMLFEKDWSVSDQFECARIDEQHPILLDIASAASTGDHNLAPLLSPRYLRSISSESLIPTSPQHKDNHNHHNHHQQPQQSQQSQQQLIGGSHSSSPQLRSLLKNQLVNNLNNSFLISSDNNNNHNINNNNQQHQLNDSKSIQPTIVTTVNNSSNSNSTSTSTPSSPKQLMRVNSAEPSPLEVAWAHLIQVRRDGGRPSDPKQMNPTELKEEKSAIKHELRNFDLKFKKDHGYLPKKNDKEVMRPLYQRYREVKALLESFPASPSPNNNKTQTPPSVTPIITSPIISHKPQNVNLNNNNNQNEIELQPIQSSQSTRPTQSTINPSSPPPSNQNQNHLELMERYSKVKSEKRSLQVELHRYQTDFIKQKGRKVQFVEDRLPVQAEYEKYKLLKQDLLELERLLSITPNNK